MICDNCKKDQLVNNFINNSNICYKCVYQKKIEKIRKKRTPKSLFCRICNEKIVHQENVKKRQRNVFCSFECAEKGHKKILRNHWTRRVRSGRVV